MAYIEHGSLSTLDDIDIDYVSLPSHLFTVDAYKTKRWFKLTATGTVLHRDGDLPSVEMANGTKEWYRDGHRHREDDKPIVIDKNGDLYWYLNDKLGRVDGQPAIVCKNGDRMWYKAGKLHRDDLPAIERANGDKYWYKRGKHHRDGDQPATITRTYTGWYKEGKKHRANGPAYISKVRLAQFEDDKLITTVWLRDTAR